MFFWLTFALKIIILASLNYYLMEMEPTNRDVFIISRCLLGVDCKYNGGNNRNEAVIEFCRTRDCISVCPETAGGLTAPRDPAERQKDGRIIDRAGRDVTAEFVNGASTSYEEAKAYAASRDARIAGAILKANSPSCGSGCIYDGSFTGTLTEGDGVFAAMLKSDGIKVYSEKTLLDMI